MKEDEGEGGRKLPRRQALLLLAGLPQVLFGLGSVGGGGGWEMGSRVQTGWLREEVLPVVAGSITASWHLLNEGEFETVERTIGLAPDIWWATLPPVRSCRRIRWRVLPRPSALGLSLDCRPRPSWRSPAQTESRPVPVGRRLRKASRCDPGQPGQGGARPAWPGQAPQPGLE